MKKIALYVAAVVLLAAYAYVSGEKASAQVKNAGTMDTVKAQKELARLMDSIDNAFKRKDMRYTSYMAKDGLFAGTDPGEIWSFEEMRTYTAQQYKDTSLKSTDFTVDKRIIRVHGMSANIIEQYVFPGISQKVMVRNVCHARYENGRWVMDMFTYNIIPKNEDLMKMDKVL